MAHPMGESKRDGLRVDFDRRLKLEFHGSKITSDGGLLAYRELDDALGLTEVAGTIFQDSRTGKNGWHGMTGQFRQSVFGRLGGYEDVNDADRLGRDPAMRWIVGGKAVERQAASTSQMGRFETELLATDANIEVLAGMNGAWIDKVHDRRPPKMIILDMDSSVSPTHGEQEGTAYNGHFGCTCYHPLFLFNQFGDLERCSLRPGNVHSADGWREVLEPVVERYRERNLRPEYEAKLEARAEKAEKTGRKPGGRPPEPPVAGPGPKDQVNLTDADSRIMPVAGGGFEQAYNAQALVAADSLLVVTNDVVQAPNDKRQIEPALEALARLPEAPLRHHR